MPKATQAPAAIPRRLSVFALSAPGRLVLVAPLVAALWLAVAWAWGGAV
ncbi:hypothetical protein [Verticiella sediminum]|nr:hypothetical protein [Verticiella sediminum]